MARRKRETRRRRIADPKYGQPIITQFINAMMWDGKRSPSEIIFYSAVDVLAKRHNRDGLEIFHEALENVRPFVEVRSRRVGGATYQIPTEVRPDRRDALAIRWIIQYARERSEKSMRERLANEILEASQKRGGAVRKKDDTHRMAEANRAFAHYRW